MDLIDIGQLTDEQRQVLYLPNHGDHVIMGCAGSGKSLMAAHRAIELATGSLQPLPTVLITYTNSLVQWFSSTVELKEAGVACSTFHKYVQSRLEKWGEPVTYLSRELKAKAMEAAVASASAKHQPLGERPLAFFWDEIDWILGMGIVSLPEYLEVERRGRGAGLGQPQRRVVWDALNAYKSLRRRDRVDFAEAGTLLREAVEKRSIEPMHVVVDEGQDFSPEVIRGLRAVARPDGSFTWFGDYTQQIYGKTMSFRSVGLKVSRIHRFTVDRRTTKEIGALARALQASAWMNEVEDRVESISAEKSGPKPVLRSFVSDKERVDWAVARARKHLTAGCTVAVLVRSTYQRKIFLEKLGGDGRELSREMEVFDSRKIYVGTIHAGKGLGFDAVIVPYAGDAEIPRSSDLEAMGEHDAREREAILLYVAITRAKRHLILASLGQPSRLLPRQERLFSETN